MGYREEKDHERLIKMLYPELRELAGRLLRRERRNHTLQQTALVHEAFMRMLKGKARLKDLPPAEFLALAAHQMRLILIDYGRKHRAKKRGGEFSRVPLFEFEHSFERDEEALLALDEALNRLAKLDQRAVKVVELKYFAGCTNDEVAEVLGVSDGTVEADWLHARLWLRRELRSLAEVQIEKGTAQRNRGINRMSESAASICVK
jgi:RNA polymerase sigma-70 factor, ECF subfamily